MKRIAIIGAGAAGCFCAQRLKELLPEVKVEVFEAQNRPLKKVAVTGGGRCNLTNSFALVDDLKWVYPRGHRLMRRWMNQWSQWDTMSWFEQRGVRLLTQDDECVFPVSQNAMEIVGTLRRGIDVKVNEKCEIRNEKSSSGRWVLESHNCQLGEFDAVVVTTGGARNFQWLERLGLRIEKPVPSLFPMKLEPTGLETLSGAVVDDATVMIPGTSFRSEGTVLVTHNGLSGPAILRLSSYAARHLADVACQTPLVVNWLGDSNEEEVRQMLREMASVNANKLVVTLSPIPPGLEKPVLTSRMWEFLVSRSGIQSDTRWSGVGQKQLNRLVATLVSDRYKVTGRVPHKEEFVTAGGVSLDNLNPRTLECKNLPGLYFAGEVCDIDGVTGGFNLQAAWTMAEVVAQGIAAI